MFSRCTEQYLAKKLGRGEVLILVSLVKPSNSSSSNLVEVAIIEVKAFVFVLVATAIVSCL